jgi:hypothetical protein
VVSVSGDVCGIDRAFVVCMCLGAQGCESVLSGSICAYVFWCVAALGATLVGPHVSYGLRCRFEQFGHRTSCLFTCACSISTC